MGAAMKTTKTRKLTLHRETLRTLDAASLARAAGGVGVFSYLLGGSCEACSEFNACGPSNMTSCPRR